MRPFSIAMETSDILKSSESIAVLFYCAKRNFLSCYRDMNAVICLIADVPIVRRGYQRLPLQRLRYATI